ncbi:hypothetical protein POKO110462_09810 [Pontibacter korlensis]|uniref:Uncharacterized protein n=1 Tax=Pontibacter korlensis TaxID=400092 RepID=A0A0E3UW51_9BACT|nr:hypothetical protein [Pontibacter korlensis]AKD03077.1 hypothetical protein PKOR_08020 [Pontibacter korlensis]
MRRHVRSSTGGISDTWNYSLSSINDSLGFTRYFTNTVNQELLDEERILRKHRLEKEQAQGFVYPSCSLDDRPRVV